MTTYVLAIADACETLSPRNEMYSVEEQMSVLDDESNPAVHRIEFDAPDGMDMEHIEYVLYGMAFLENWVAEGCFSRIYPKE